MSLVRTMVYKDNKYKSFNDTLKMIKANHPGVKAGETLT